MFSISSSDSFLYSRPFVGLREIVCAQTCKELEIPIHEGELTDVSSPWESKDLGTLMPVNSAEKKVQEYFIEKLRNLENKQFGFFYKIKNLSGNTRGYLFGTIHDMTPFGERLELHKKIYNSFDKTKFVAFENDPVTWRKFLFNHSLDRMAREAEALQKMDLEFSILAHQQGKIVYDLEPFHILPPGKETEKPNFSLILAALHESSEIKLEKFLQGLDTPEETQKLNARNEQMVEKILNYLNSCEPERIFIAVGAAHMVGEKGIPKLLSEKYKIKQIKAYRNDLFVHSLNKDFFKLSTNTIIFIARSISRTRTQENAPIHSDMALCDIVITLLKKGVTQSIVNSALLIAEKIHSDDQKKRAFKEIADFFVERGDSKQAIDITRKYSCYSHQCYPGYVALRLAKQGKFEQALATAKLIEAERYPQHRNAAFTAVAVIMARQGMTIQALNIVEEYIHQKDLQDITKASINKIATCYNVQNELKQIADRAGHSYSYSSLLHQLSDLEKLFKSLKKYGLGTAFSGV